jgi:hypothetical protein
MHGPKKEWVGNVVFADNHTDTINNFFPTQVSYLPQNAIAIQKDNIFSNWEQQAGTTDFPPSGEASKDIWLVCAVAATQNDVDEVYDELVN